MSHFCHQIRYTTTAWTRVLENSQDRFEAVRAPIESLGGTLHTAFFAMDSFDVLAISELPEDVSISDIAVQFFSSGDVAHIQTTKLLAASQVLEVIQKAGPCSYRPLPRRHSLTASAT